MPKLGAFGAGSTKGSGFQGRIPTTPSGQVQFTTAGTGTWTVPAYVTKVNVLVMGGGGGGGGNGRNGSGGGGGGLAYANDIPVSPGASISYNVGAGGAINSNGSASWFNSSSYLYANGGNTGTLAAASDATASVFLSSATITNSVSAINPRYSASNVNGTIGPYYYGTWTCPAGVWSISVVCIGGGGAGCSFNSTSLVAGSGGQGGSTAYRNNIAVIPGTVYTVHIGGAGSTFSTSGITTFTDQGGGCGGDTVFFDIIGITATATNGQNITLSDVSRLTTNAIIIFKGTSFGNITDYNTTTKKYIITGINGTNKTITVKDTWGSSVSSISWATATGTMTVESTSIMATGGAGGHGSGSTPLANVTFNVIKGTGGGYGGTGGVPTGYLGAGGGGAGGYIGTGTTMTGGTGGSPTGDTSAAGGAATAGSGGGGGGPSGGIDSGRYIRISSVSGSGSSAIYYVDNTTGGLTAYLTALNPVSNYNGVSITKVSGTGVLQANSTISLTVTSQFSISPTPTTLPAANDVYLVGPIIRIGGSGGGGVSVYRSATTTGASSAAVVTGVNPTLRAGTPGSTSATQVTTTSVNTGGYGAQASTYTTTTYGAGGGGVSVGTLGGAYQPISGAMRIIYQGSLDITSTSNTSIATVAYSATGYAGGGGGGAAGWSGRGGMGGSATNTPTTNGGNGGLGGGTVAGAVNYQGGPGGNSFLGASAYGAGESIGNGAAAGGAGGINPYGGGGIGYLIQSDLSLPGLVATTAGSAVLSGYAGSAAYNGGSGGYMGSFGGGGIYGGGGPGGGNGGPGGTGFVRVIWGPGRSYPTTLTRDVVQANQLVQGVTYTIGYPGDTNWVSLGAANNASGTTFTKNSSTGSGSGSAYVA